MNWYEGTTTQLGYANIPRMAYGDFDDKGITPSAPPAGGGGGGGVALVADGVSVVRSARSSVRVSARASSRTR